MFEEIVDAQKLPIGEIKTKKKLKNIIMGESFKMKCPNCGALLKINETGELFPGGKEREEAYCPKCHHEVYSAMTSGFVKAFEISEDEFNE